MPHAIYYASAPSSTEAHEAWISAWSRWAVDDSRSCRDEAGHAHEGREQSTDQDESAISERAEGSLASTIPRGVHEARELIGR